MAEVKTFVKRWIKPLPKNVINKIAAGEVVERPASVLKELVENAVDAGSDRIEIVIEKSGSTLIRVVDNGCGIDEEQLEIAFSRHATSKITNFADLERLSSYGFRGEALPSIASVSRLRMVSRTADSDSGTEIIIEGGILQSKKPIAAQVGTTIEVEDLFFNTPARRKFLKSQSTETRYLARIATAMAISSYRIAFSATLNGKKIFALRPDNSLSDRATVLLGNNNKFIAVTGQLGPVRLEGAICLPENVRNNRYGQYLFINGRFISSPTISHAWVSGYGELIPRGLFPVGALLLTIDPTQVDVNVHPSKTEVRLAHEREVYDAVKKLVAESLRQDGIIPNLRPIVQQQGFSGSGSNQKDYNSISGIANNAAAKPELIAQLYKTVSVDDEDSVADSNRPIEIDKNTGEVITPSNVVDSDFGPASGFRFIGRFDNLYLLIAAGDALFIIDQHTAHERVLYEEMLEKVEKQAVNAQHLLFPVQVELDPEQYAVFEESLEMLNGSGFTVSPFGGRMVNIEAVPAIMSKKSPEKMFSKVIDDIMSLRKTGYDIKKAMAQSIACRSAVMAGDFLTEAEAIGLMELLLKCQDRYSCPHGRPTFLRFSRKDLDRQFGRT
ncbi:MAG: DNA mismatch repair endonuclease MutL [candidate division Zixibacteria bacterium]|nr:DNA mismatch repair endonuclease MutL [candidate division Zixibacteria bacterium]